MSRLLRLWLSDDGNPPKFSTTVPVHLVNRAGLGECGMWLLEAMKKNKAEKKERGGPIFPDQDANEARWDR